ncbi:MAG: ABC transporter permease [Nitrospirae bacterium]|nr:ABC transporter permease [Nitrospirota bacterium]
MRFETIVWRNLLRRRVRSILTVLGIGIAIGAMIAQVSITRGFIKSISRLMETRNVQMVVSKKESPDPIFSSLPEDLAKGLLEVPHVDGLIGVLVDMVTIGNQPGVAVFGFRFHGEARSHLKIIHGRDIAGPGRHEIVIGWSLANRMKKKVGDKLNIEVDLYELVGIYETGNMIEDNSAAMALEDVQDLMSRPSQVTFYNVLLDDVKNMDVAKKEIETRFPHVLAMGAGELADTLDAIQMAKVMAWILSVVSIVIGAVATMNTMLMSVFERTREIGILRALGWKRRKIFRLILSESVLLSVFGWVVGIGVGIFGVWVINEIPRVSGTLPGKFDAVLLGQAFGIAVGLGAIGAFYPAYRATNVSPSEALRYE